MKTTVPHVFSGNRRSPSAPVRRKAAACLLFLAVLLPAAAQVSVEAVLNRNRVPLNEHVVLSVEVKNGNGDEIVNMPRMPAFRARSAGQSSQTSIVNGQVSRSVIYNYILYPVKTGRFEVPEIEVRDGNQTYRTRPIHLEVVPAGTAAAHGTGTSRQDAADGLDVVLELDRKNVYVDQPVILRLKIYRRLDVRLRAGKYDLPALSDFIVETGEQENGVELVNGVKYEVTEIRNILYPSRSGTFEIGPAWLHGQVIERNPGRGRSRRRSLFDFGFDDFFDDPFMDDPFFGGGSLRPVRRQSNAVTLEVKSPPDTGRPDDFTGTVGSYELDVSYSGIENCRQGDPVTVTLTVSGEGHVSTITEPVQTGLEGFKTFDSEVTVTPRITRDRVGGSKVFKKIIVPEKAGTLSLPDVRFTFFDPSRREYVTLEKKGPEVEVAPAPEGDGSGQIFEKVSTASSRKNPEITGRDIIFIETDPAVLDRQPLRISWKIFWAAVAAGPLALLSSFLFAHFHLRVMSDPKLKRRRIAFRRFRRRLNEALSRADPDSAGAAAGMLSEALSDYLSDRMNQPSGTWTARDVDEKLPPAGIPEELCGALKRHLDFLDQTRFGMMSLPANEWKTRAHKIAETVKKLENTPWKTA